MTRTLRVGSGRWRAGVILGLLLTAIPSQAVVHLGGPAFLPGRVDLTHSPFPAPSTTVHETPGRG